MRGIKSSDLDRRAFGIIQVSCGLHVGTFRRYRLPVHRMSLGIDEQYKGIRERVDLLARHAEVNERIRTERETAEVTIIGAILAIVLIALATLTVPGSTWYFQFPVIAGSVLVVMLLVVYRFVRSKRRWLRRLL
jgi:hypothetical protein